MPPFYPITPLFTLSKTEMRPGSMVGIWFLTHGSYFLLSGAALGARPIREEFYTKGRACPIAVTYLVRKSDQNGELSVVRDQLRSRISTQAQRKMS